VWDFAPFEGIELWVVPAYAALCHETKPRLLVSSRYLIWRQGVIVTEESRRRVCQVAYIQEILHCRLLLGKDNLSMEERAPWAPKRSAAEQFVKVAGVAGPITRGPALLNVRTPEA
jgi:hypothetical protein